MLESKKRKRSELLSNPDESFGYSSRSLRADTNSLLSYLGDHIRVKAKRILIRKPVKIKQRQHLFEGSKNVVVFLRHGSLTDGSRINLKLKEMSERVGIKVKTVTTILRNWRHNSIKVKD